MTPMVDIVLLGWIPFVLALFLVMEPRRAAIAAFLGAWLFLPHGGYSIEGLPDFNKVTATSFGTLLGMILLDPNQPLLKVRWGWIDLPMTVWCIVPLFSSLSNGLGLYDGISSIFYESMIWGLPYLIGRAYFTDLAGLRDLAVGIFIGGLLYVPLCLIEMRLSPQLHNWVYGFAPTDFVQTKRWGGYRPVVFMQHGLMVALFMTSASLIGAWLWRSRTLTHLMGVPMAVLVPILLITTVLCKSVGALALLALGLAAMYIARHMRTAWILAALVFVPPVYLTARITNVWTGHSVVPILEAVVGEGRASSLNYRLDNEMLLLDRARERLALGWGGWNRHRIVKDGSEEATTDSLWIITLGTYGLVGLSALVSLSLLPVFLLVRHLGNHLVTHPLLSHVMCLSVVLMLYMYDNLLNAMVNPILMLVAGGLAGFYYLNRHARVRAMPAQAAPTAPGRPRPRLAAGGPATVPTSAGMETAGGADTETVS